MICNSLARAASGYVKLVIRFGLAWLVSEHYGCYNENIRKKLLKTFLKFFCTFSRTWINDNLWILTTCQQRISPYDTTFSLCRGSHLRSLENNQLSTMATFSCPEVGWCTKVWQYFQFFDKIKFSFYKKIPAKSTSEERL